MKKIADTSNQYLLRVVCTGFTLMEVIIVLIIVGILATLGIANFQRTRTYSLNKEAFANLKLIQAAQRVYEIDNSYYYPQTGSVSVIDTINTNLRLALSSGASRNWNYRAVSTGCSEATTTAFAQFTQNWRLDITNNGDPVNGTCP